MTFWMGIGFFSALAVGLIIWAIFKKTKKDVKYDERQIAARGDAYKAGFITFVICELVVFFIELFTEEPLVLFAPGSLQMIITLFSLLIFVEVSIFNDAYYAATQKFSLRWCIIMLLLAGCYILQFIRSDDKWYKILVLAAAIFIIIVIVSIMIKQILIKKENAKLEEEEKAGE